MLAKVELNYYPEESLEKKYTENNGKNNRKRAPKRKQENNVSFKVRCFIVAILLMITSLFILLRYANITKMRMEVTNLEKEKVELEKVKMNLAADLEGVKNSLKISEDATYKLGMSYPQEDQIVYVSVDDVVEESTDNLKIADQLGKVVSIFSSLF